MMPPFLKNFSLSTILGLVFGISLVAYAVFAYTPPTQAPPGGNTSAPVNVGSASQVKSGGLSVGSLIVDGGLKTGGFSSLPTCNASTEGTLVFNTNINKISLCTNSTWEVFPTGIDFDEDGFIAGTDCNDGNAAVWQFKEGYPDSDIDNHFSPLSTTVCSGDSLPPGYSISVGDDCNDNCSTCYPSSTAYTLSPDGKDQDCDGLVDENDFGQSTSCGDVYLVYPDAITDACKSWCGGADLYQSSSCTISYAPQNEGKYFSFDFGNCSKSNKYATNVIYCAPGAPATCQCKSAYR